MPPLLLTPAVIDRLIHDNRCYFKFCTAEAAAAAYKNGKFQPHKGCGGCRSSKRNKRRIMVTQVNYSTVKTQIMALPAAALADLKKILECEELLIQWRHESGSLRKKII